MSNETPPRSWRACFSSRGALAEPAAPAALPESQSYTSCKASFKGRNEVFEFTSKPKWRGEPLLLICHEVIEGENLVRRGGVVRADAKTSLATVNVVVE